MEVNFNGGIDDMDEIDDTNGVTIFMNNIKDGNSYVGRIHHTKCSSHMEIYHINENWKTYLIIKRLNVWNWQNNEYEG